MSGFVLPERVLVYGKPVDMRKSFETGELKGSSLELDLYSWAVYATYIAMTRREPFRITWTRLHQNLGADYTRPPFAVLSCEVLNAMLSTANTASHAVLSYAAGQGKEIQPIKIAPRLAGG